jgi:flagellar biogenesis protein FliO
MELVSVAGVLIVFGLLGLLLFVLKRRGFVSFRDVMLAKTKGPRDLQAIDRLSLTPAHSLHVVRACGRTLLLSVGPQSCQYIADLDTKEPSK